MLENAATSPLNPSIPNSPVQSLVQPQTGQIHVNGDDDAQGTSTTHATAGHPEQRTDEHYVLRSRKAAAAVTAWDPSYETEEVDWYSEYIARHGPVSLSWLQQPHSKHGRNKKERYEVKGMGLLRDWSHAGEDKVVAPLENGGVCIWDLNRSHNSSCSFGAKGGVIGMSAPGILTQDMSRGASESKSVSTSFVSSVGESVSVDSIRRRAYFAAGSVLNEVDLETLAVVSQQRYQWPIFALSQETDYSAPLTLATTLTLQIYDSRSPVKEEEEALCLCCDMQRLSLDPRHIRSPSPPGKDVNSYTPLFPPSALSILHPPAPHVNTILLAGRFPSILCYDRRYFPRLQNAVHSGGRLCCLAPVPGPGFPVFSDSAWPKSHNVVACGEYNGKGSLELYDLSSSSSSSSSSTQNQEDPLSNTSSNLSPIYNNRQTAARSKLLSVQSHGTRIVYSDSEGNIRWVERDGRTEVRRFNIDSYIYELQHPHPQLPRDRDRDRDRENTTPVPDGDGNDLNVDFDPFLNTEPGGLWHSDPSDYSPSYIARKLLPTGENLAGDELLVWTGDRIGRVRFSAPADSDIAGEGDESDDLDDDDDDDGMSVDAEVDESTREETRKRKREERQREQEYARMMRRALETQADEVRWLGGLGL